MKLMQTIATRMSKSSKYFLKKSQASHSIVRIKIRTFSGLFSPQDTKKSGPILVAFRASDNKFNNNNCNICRDQPNSRFHGRDIFREIGLLPWKTPISVKSVKFCEIREKTDFSWILTLLLSFMKVFRVLSTTFVRILLFATCHTWSSWHVFTVTYLHPVLSLDLVH